MEHNFISIYVSFLEIIYIHVPSVNTIARFRNIICSVVTGYWVGCELASRDILPPITCSLMVYLNPLEGDHASKDMFSLILRSPIVYLSPVKDDNGSRCMISLILWNLMVSLSVEGSQASRDIYPLICYSLWSQNPLDDNPGLQSRISLRCL